MKLLYVSSDDVMGGSFNGYALHRALRRAGHDAHMAVLRPTVREESVHPIAGPGLRALDRRLAQFERRFSFHSLLSASACALYAAPHYRAADLVHLQLLHAAPGFSLLHLPLMGRQRPLVWTLHDPWPLSGHCVHPLECERWRTGCGRCPDLGLPFPIRHDTTAAAWRIKRWILRASRLTLVVASRWMEARVRQSPIFAHLPCRRIPFGIDADIFRTRDRAACRARLGLPLDAHVLAFRCVEGFRNFKGTEHVARALARLAPSRPTVLLTFDESGGLAGLRDKYAFRELGWVADPYVVADALSAADLFLMPSIAESFGMMGVEAIACGTPVVCFAGVANADAVFAPRAAVAVPYRDDDALAAAIGSLLADPGRRARLGEEGARLAREEYSFGRYVERHLELYAELLARS